MSTRSRRVSLKFHLFRVTNSRVLKVFGWNYIVFERRLISISINLRYVDGWMGKSWEHLSNVIVARRKGISLPMWIKWIDLLMTREKRGRLLIGTKRRMEWNLKMMLQMKSRVLGNYYPPFFHFSWKKIISLRFMYGIYILERHCTKRKKKGKKENRLFFSTKVTVQL